MMLTPEEECLCKAVDDFASEMKSMLLKKNREGFIGWDNPIAFSQCKNIDALQYQLNKLKVTHDLKNHNIEVHIANFAMMHRIKRNKLS